MAKNRQMPSNIGDKMQIKCLTCGKFLFEINIEEYIGDLERLGIEQQTPVVINIPCKGCKTIQKFDIYKDKIFMKSRNRHN